MVLRPPTQPPPRPPPSVQLSYPHFPLCPPLWEEPEGGEGRWGWHGTEEWRSSLLQFLQFSVVLLNLDCPPDLRARCHFLAVPALNPNWFQSGSNHLRHNGAGESSVDLAVIGSQWPLALPLHLCHEKLVVGRGRGRGDIYLSVRAIFRDFRCLETAKRHLPSFRGRDGPNPRGSCCHADPTSIIAYLSKEGLECRAVKQCQARR